MPATVPELLASVPRPGTLTWIGLRTARRGPVEVVDAAEALVDRGLAGDRRATRAADPKARRQVTLLQAEHLPVIAGLLGRDPASGPLDPALLRRNLVVAGINLAALKGRRFRVGAVTLEATGWCHPCSRMEEVLGPGGYQAVRGHGGLTARIVTGGTLHRSDAVTLSSPDPAVADAT